MVVGLGLPWVIHLHRVLIQALGPLAGFTAVLALSFPLAFAALFLMVRVVPRLVSPPLVLHHNDPITTLNLTTKREEQSPGNHSLQ